MKSKLLNTSHSTKHNGKFSEIRQELHSGKHLHLVQDVTGGAGHRPGQGGKTSWNIILWGSYRKKLNQ